MIQYTLCKIFGTRRDFKFVRNLKASNICKYMQNIRSDRRNNFLSTPNFININVTDKSNYDYTLDEFKTNLKNLQVLESAYEHTFEDIRTFANVRFNFITFIRTC